jgi:hypothetical protein
MYPDQWAEEQERQQRLAPPDGQSRLVGALLDAVRRMQITASPPAHLKPIVWSQPVDLSAQVSVPAAVGAYATAVTYTVPPGRWARIESYGVQVMDPAYTYNGSILWRFLKNGHQFGVGLADWGIQRGSLSSPRKTFILLKEDDVLEFQVRRAVLAVGAQDVQMGLTGYTWVLRMNYEGTAASVTSW